MSPQQFTRGVQPVAIIRWLAACCILLCAGACSPLFPDDKDKIAAPAADTASVDGAEGADGSPAAIDAGARPVACPAGTGSTDPTARIRPAKDACPAQTPPWFDKDKAPTATLTLEAGVWDATNEVFVPWTDGQWAPIHWGMRMGAGVWTALRVKLPGETAATVELEISVPGLVDCKVVGTTIPKTASFKAVDGEPGVYVHGDAIYPGACILMAYKETDADAMCDRWMTIQAAVRRPDTDIWGEVVNVVRLYLGSAGP